MTSVDPFVHYDAAYAFGALDPADRVAFEGHLADCADCRDRVAEARRTVALLSAAGTMPATPDSPEDAPPDLLLPRLLRAAGRERRRRRLVTGGLAGLAAACVVALVVAVWPVTGDDGGNEPPPRPFVAVRSAPVEASALLVSRTWGTEIKLQCRYTRQLQQGTTYRLVVVDTARKTYDAGGWTLGGTTTDFTGGTEVPKDDIALVQITLADGRPILQLTP